MNRRQMIALVGAVALIAAAAIILYFRLTSVRQQLPEVRVGYLNITASVPFFIAEQEGASRKIPLPRGLRIRFKESL